MLSTNRFACSRGGRVLFKDLSLTASPGTWVQVTGTNGAGKTTLLRSLVGLCAPGAVLPLCGTTLLFDADAVVARTAGLSAGSQLFIPGALLVVTAFLAPWAATGALRIALE